MLQLFRASIAPVFYNSWLMQDRHSVVQMEVILWHFSGLLLHYLCSSDRQSSCSASGVCGVYTGTLVSKRDVPMKEILPTVQCLVYRCTGDSGANQALGILPPESLPAARQVVRCGKAVKTKFWYGSVKRNSLGFLWNNLGFLSVVFRGGKQKQAEMRVSQNPIKF